MIILKLKYIITFILLQFFFGFKSTAQAHTVTDSGHTHHTDVYNDNDSLFKIFSSYTTRDSTKLKYLIAWSIIAQKYHDHIEESTRFADSAVLLAIELKRPLELAEAHAIISTNFKIEESGNVERIPNILWSGTLGLAVIVILLLIFLPPAFYRNKLKQAKLKMELQKQKAEAEFQRNLADVKLSSLRSQMNPHFIFNCLNSIKLYTTQNDTASAVEYLTKFSRLMRLVMENSSNDRIFLSSELEALKLYIEMEAMRFKEKLSYNIHVEDNVDTNYIEIPPLLLQPYVENAIWHGLMHKEDGGKIDINVACNNDESILEINITDNGVGRIKSTELKSKTATKNKSYGMKVTSERIALINQVYKTGASVAINDLTTEDGKPLGTRVTIQIPV